MVWASTSSVGFGIKGKWVVAFYCDNKATPADQTATFANIGSTCMKAGINECLNDLALEAHNKKRMIHATKPLKFDDEIARTLQRQMDQEESFTGALPAGAADANCMTNTFEQTDATKVTELVTSNAATDAWYDGMGEFNFATGEPIAPRVEERKKMYEDFTRMMWKKTTKVGFGIRDKWVIARYCDEPIVKAPTTSAAAWADFVTI